MSALATVEHAPALVGILSRGDEDGDVRFHALLALERLRATLPEAGLRALSREEWALSSGRRPVGSAYYEGDEWCFGDSLPLFRTNSELRLAFAMLDEVTPEARAIVLTKVARWPDDFAPAFGAWLYHRWYDDDRAALATRDAWPTNADVARATSDRATSRALLVDAWRDAPEGPGRRDLLASLEGWRELDDAVVGSDELLGEAAGDRLLPGYVLAERYGSRAALASLGRVIVSNNRALRDREPLDRGELRARLRRAFRALATVPGHREWLARLPGRCLLDEAVFDHVTAALWGVARAPLVAWALDRGRKGGDIGEVRPVVRRVAFAPREGERGFLTWAASSPEPSLRYLAARGLGHLVRGRGEDALRRLAFGPREFRSAVLSSGRGGDAASDHRFDDLHSGLFVDEVSVFDEEAFVRLGALGALARWGDRSAREQLACEAEDAPSRRQRSEALGWLVEAAPAAAAAICERAVSRDARSSVYGETPIGSACAPGVLARLGTAAATSTLVRGYGLTNDYGFLLTLRRSVVSAVERSEGGEGPRSRRAYDGEVPSASWRPAPPTLP